MGDVVLEEQTFSEVKRLCCVGLDGPALLGEVVERLRRVVPSEAYCASTKDPASGFITHGLAEEMGGADDIFWSLERLYFDHHQSVRRMVDTHQPVALLSETTGGDLERSTRYAEYLRPLGLSYEMRGAFTSGGYLWGSMDLIRGAGSPDFKPREVNLLRRVAPHLGNGLKMAALRMQTPLEEGGRDVPGVLTLDNQGSVVQHTPAAERWLRDLEDLGPGWREREGLPRALRTVVLSLRRALSPERDWDEERVPTHTRASTLGALVDALRLSERGDPGAARGDGDHNRTHEARRVAAFQHDCLRTEPPRRRTREARRAWPLYDADLPGTLYLRAYRTEPSPQHLREGRSAQQR
jgi:hypothetical protein